MYPDAKGIQVEEITFQHLAWENSQLRERVSELTNILKESLPSRPGRLALGELTEFLGV